MSKQYRETFGVLAPLYTVMVYRKDGTRFAALAGGNNPVWLSRHRPDAELHRDDLKSKGFTCRVARITVTVETLPPRKRAKKR